RMTGNPGKQAVRLGHCRGTLDQRLPEPTALLRGPDQHLRSGDAAADRFRMVVSPRLAEIDPLSTVLEGQLLSRFFARDHRGIRTAAGTIPRRPADRAERRLSAGIQQRAAVAILDPEHAC